MLRTLCGFIAATWLLHTAATHPFAQAVRAQSSVGTWTLSSMEQWDAAGNTVVIANPRGILVQDGLGNAIQVLTRGGRAAYDSDSPTPREALQAFSTYAGFWGTYNIDEKTSTATYQFKGDINPGHVGKQERRTLVLTGDRMVIAHPPDDRGFTLRTTWQRVPDLETVPPSQQRLVGFWQWVSEQRIADNGAVIQATMRDPSVIVYTPTGYVVVHFPQAGRKAFASTIPTPDEGLTAIVGYVSYFGPYVIQPERGYVYHHRMAVLNPPGQVGGTLQRFFDVSDSQLILRFPPEVANGQTYRSVVTAKRLSAWADLRSPSQ